MLLFFSTSPEAPIQATTFFFYLLLEPLVRECDACHTSDRLVKVQMVQFLTRNLESSAINDRLYNCNMSVSDM